MLQCGDLLRTGWGEPGYAFRDELASANQLENWPGFPDGSRKVYPRGSLAMANGGPDTNGSQFFLVYEDSRLRLDYTVSGHVSEEGIKVLDTIAAGDIARAAVEPRECCPVGFELIGPLQPRPQHRPRGFHPRVEAWLGLMQDVPAAPCSARPWRSSPSWGVGPGQR